MSAVKEEQEAEAICPQEAVQEQDPELWDALTCTYTSFLIFPSLGSSSAPSTGVKSVPFHKQSLFLSLCYCVSVHNQLLITLQHPL